MSMKLATLSLLCMAVMSATCLSPMSRADEPKSINTSITISDLHCEACAKKVAKKLATVKNVASASVDVKSTKATVKPKKETSASPKALWEAVEAAGYTPTKLEGPDGTFTEKPKT